jgi:aminoglycoside 6-adenylyltransferase
VPSIHALTASVLAWAQRDDNVIAVITTGSRSRAIGDPDDLSDLDLEVIARDPDRLLDDDAWFRAFGDVWVAMRFDDRQYPTRLVVYDDGSKIDFTVAGVERLREMDDDLDPVYDRGYRVLLDKDGVARRLPTATGAFPVHPPPTQAEYTATVEEFWFEATHFPRYLVRDDLWVVKFRDWTMKTDLLRMLEWNAAARSEEPIDVYFVGARMKEWVDDTTWRQLDHAFGRFDHEDAWRALLATTDLFARLSREVAERVGLRYPEELEQHVRGYLASFDSRFAP